MIEYKSKFVTINNNDNTCEFEVKIVEGKFPESGLKGVCFKGSIEDVSENVIVYAYTIADIVKHAKSRLVEIIDITMPIDEDDASEGRTIVFSCGDSFIRRVFKE